MDSDFDYQWQKWHRVSFQDIPIYIHPDKPDWFVPNSMGDEILRKLTNNVKADEYGVLSFLKRLPDSQSHQYAGRHSYLKLERLSELWFHITNRCNLACTHCLFSSSKNDNEELHATKLLNIAAEAYQLGCRVFVLTGGEPFLHPEINIIIDGLMDYPDSHVAVLTNGMNLPDFLGKKRYDYGKFHLQISVDGIGPVHNRIRGQGTFEKIEQNLGWLQQQKIPYTLSMCVNKQNVCDMPGVVHFGAIKGAGNVHFLWHFVKGRGVNIECASPESIFENLILATKIAEKNGILIDNIESLKTHIFVPSGTIHDGYTAGWESLTIGPDGKIYPSAALVTIPELATEMSSGIETAWLKSEVLEKIRQCTAATTSSLFRYLIGGGDIDQSYIHKKSFIGDDPYQTLYEKMVLWLLARESLPIKENGHAQIKLRMGEILESCGAHGKVALVHSNCLLATAQENNSLIVVKSFYSDAAGDKKEEILNPVSYNESLISHIPLESRYRGYGCGSPITDADIQKGEHIVDLGCGTGVECFIASRLTGETGRVTGVDMLYPMLELAEKGLAGVSENLGYCNIRFAKGYLEMLPIKDNSADVVISNCVMNLSVNKRRAYSEILRILRPGGRLVISDVVCETEPDPEIRNDETLRGECIAGAMTQRHLLALLEDTGFIGIRLIKRFPYRVVSGHSFFSLTYSTIKPGESDTLVDVIYRGPLPWITTWDGRILMAGVRQTVRRDQASMLGDQIFILDQAGKVTNIEAESTCGCFTSPVEQKVSKKAGQGIQILESPRLTRGCMACGASLTYLSADQAKTCVYCNKSFMANSVCENGHFVCDACHGVDALEIIRHISVTTDETDMIRLLKQIRQHPAVPLHGPEHHSLIPAIILSTFRNLGGNIPLSLIESGINRGKTIAGGACAFMGCCGVATGVGIAFSLILEANPLTPEKRKRVQEITHTVLADIARLKAARCCQRESWLGLKKAATLSKQYLSIILKGDESLICTQKDQNTGCMGKKCPLYR